MFGFASFGAKFLDVAEDIYKRKNVLNRYWFYTAIWIVLLLWGLQELFS